MNEKAWTNQSKKIFRVNLFKILFKILHGTSVRIISASPARPNNAHEWMTTFHRSSSAHFHRFMLLAALKLVIELSEQRETRPLSWQSSQ